MTIAAVRQALRSDAPMVVIEAPAGCGKTHEAVGGAIDLARGLPDHQEVLLLAHTNAAVQEFRRRAREYRVPIRASTLDAFALELVAPYARRLGLPTPLRVGEPEGVPFDALAPKLVELLENAPSIVNALATHYPVAIFDEHQDARVDQHHIATILAATGRTRVRIFGDAMQAIYSFAGQQLVDWERLCADAPCVYQLDDPKRWADSPELGVWIMLARTALAGGEKLPLESAPPEVKLRLVPDLQDMPNPNTSQVARELFQPLQESAVQAAGSIAVLTIYNQHVLGLRRAVRRLLPIQEGADFTSAYESLDRAQACEGQPKELALIILDLVAKTASGMTNSTRTQLERCLHEYYLDTSRQRRFLAFLGILQTLYQQPDLITWCKAVARVGQQPPPGVNIDYPAVFQILGTLRPIQGEDVRMRLDAVLHYRREVTVAPYRCVSTIHKAKGQEFDHVVVAHCSRSPFPDTPSARKLLYVAISRARKSITILASAESPSPLLG